MDKVTLRRDEKISWMMNAFACIITSEHYAVMERLTPLSHEAIDVIDRVVTSGGADSVREALLGDYPIDDIVEACRILPKHERSHNAITALAVIGALKNLGLPLTNLDVHLSAGSSTLSYVGRAYAQNHNLIRLVEEMPDQLDEIIRVRLKRKTSDAGLIREALTTGRPLEDGAL